MCPYIMPHNKKRRRAIRIEALRSLFMLTLILSALFLSSYCYHPVISLPDAPDFKTLPDIADPDIMSEPVQQILSPARRFTMKGYAINAVAAYAVTARILSIQYHQFDGESSLSPIDLALGWQRMSQDETLEAIKISQSGRFYFTKYNKPPIPRQEIVTGSANTHIIPADQAVWKQLRRLRKNDIVTLHGYLVNVSGKRGFQWNTSMTRGDTGDGACEIFYVLRVTKR